MTDAGGPESLIADHHRAPRAVDPGAEEVPVTTELDTAVADATEGDHLVENTDSVPTAEDGPQDVDQEPISEAEAEADTEDPDDAEDPADAAATADGDPTGGPA